MFRFDQSFQNKMDADGLEPDQQLQNGRNRKFAMGPPRARRTLVLCFDGTGNKFQGNDGDSNILKIYSMVNRADESIFTYYQPGIGTYVEDSSLTKSGRLEKLRSWYKKAKDQAVGTSFDTHVMAGYKFLMRFYNKDDDIYMFGFSRGAYTARFLAQMLDCVGLLAAGNEEMTRFAWKTFAQWQSRLEGTGEEKKAKAEQYEFMRKFRETFSIPVRRIRFLGLFDTVNSVPRFETAWMSRSKFPYTSRSTAKVIRHAVSIDERRAKFRQDLCSQQNPVDDKHHHHPHLERMMHLTDKDWETAAESRVSADGRPKAAVDKGEEPTYSRYRPTTRKQRQDITQVPDTRDNSPSRASLNSMTAVQDAKKAFDPQLDEDDEDAPQDVQEVWFPGCHADIGGGWPLVQGEKVSLSHAPLLWMLREARNAGLPFDDDRLRGANYLLEDFSEEDSSTTVPELAVDGKPIVVTQDKDKRDRLLQNLHVGCTQGQIHDALCTGQGTPLGGVLSWKIMEYLPFRRMNLESDGSWKPIRWPLPCGETRDIPGNAVIHHTALKRMEDDSTYRPGNLIVGGGGRGLRKAPEKWGTGKWRVVREKGDPIGEVVVRAIKTPTGV